MIVRRLDGMATRSRLLSLPRELRDMIYEYALTDCVPLSALVERSLTGYTTFRRGNDEGFQGRSDPYRYRHGETNPLRFVCHQLHNETSALALRYNDLIFYCPDGWNPVTVYDLFDHFYDNCSPIYLVGIRKITIDDDKTTVLDDLNVPDPIIELTDLISPTLDSFAYVYPNAKVIVCFYWVVSWVGERERERGEHDEVGGVRLVVVVVVVVVCLEKVREKVTKS